MVIFVDFGQGFLHLGNFGNLNLTLESAQISTSWSQTPDEGIGTLSGKCCTQEVFDDSHLSGNIDGTQIDVEGKGIRFMP